MKSSNIDSDTTTSKETVEMAKTTVTLSDAEQKFILAFRALLDSAAPVGVDEDVEEVEDDDEVEEVEDDEDEEEVEVPDRQTAQSMGIKELRELATSLDLGVTKKAEILAALEEYWDDEDEEVEDDEEEEDEEAESEYDRDDLEELTLKELKKIAGEEHAASELKGLDKDALIDLIVGEEDEDDEEDDEDEDDDDDADVLDEDDLKAMSHKELMVLAKELEIKVPTAVRKSTTANQKKLVKIILDSGEDE